MSILLPDEPGLVIQTAQTNSSTLTLYLRATQPEVTCPLCGQLTTKIQSLYQRKLADLSWANYSLQLILQVRRFFCLNLECARQIFCERLSQLTKAYARQTNRLNQRLLDLALALGGRPAARLADKQDLKVSRSSLLRRLLNYGLPTHPTPRVLGVDDFALRKGRRYATLLVDLEKQCPIEVLPDRTSETLAKWLVEHPGVEIVSRDRDSGYAKAVRQSAPNAVQVADRFHILKNLRDYLDEFFTRKQVWLSELAEAKTEKSPSASPAQTELKASELPPLAASSLKLKLGLAEAKTERPPTKEARLKADRYLKRLDRYEQVRELSEGGLSNREIARHLDLNKNTVNRYIQASGAQEAVGSKSRPAQPTLIDPYKVYLYERWREEQPTISQLQQELREQGYTGSSGPIRAFLARLRPKAYWSATRTKQKHKLSPQQIPALNSDEKLTSRSASWLLFKLDLKDEELTQEQRQRLQQLREKDTQIEEVYQLVQEFRRIVREKREDDLADWLKRAKGSKIKELVSFSKGIELDRAAVEAGLSLPYSNGQLEGQVNRVKNIKRQMYGRAKFTLLRIRILA